MLLWTQFLLLHLVTLMLLFVLMTPWVAAIDQWASNSGGGSEEGNAVKIDICHRRADGTFSLININKNAQQAHVNHGDGLPEDNDSPYPDLDFAIFGPDCQPECLPGCECGEFQENVGFECPCFTGTAKAVNKWCKTLDEDDRCCVGSNACVFALGVGTATICKGACRGDSACWGIGQFKIGVDACDGKYSCADIAGGLFGSGEIGSGACKGRSACSQLGYQAQTVSIAENACRGRGSCFNVGYSAEETVSIAENACRAVNICSNYGRTCTGTVTIDVDDVDGSNVVNCA